MIFSVFQKNRDLGYSWSNKTWWKPCFPMDKRPLVEGRIANFGIFLDVFHFLRFGWFCPFLKKIVFWGILGPLYSGIGATIRIGQEMLCLPIAGFFFVIVQAVLIPAPTWWVFPNKLRLFCQKKLKKKVFVLSFIFLFLNIFFIFTLRIKSFIREILVCRLQNPLIKCGLFETKSAQKKSFPPPSVNDFPLPTYSFVRVGSNWLLQNPQVF